MICIYYTIIIIDISQNVLTQRRRLGGVSCQTIEGPYSGKNDDALSTASCPAGFTLTSCGIKTYWLNIDGSYIRNNICYARNGAGGNGVKAVARCCNLGSSINGCRDVTSSKSGTGDDHYITSSCGSNEVAFGCTASTYWKEMDGGCPGGGSCYNKPGRTNPGASYPLINKCTAVNGAGGNGVFAEARCCSAKNGKSYECIERWGTKSGTSDDAKSIIGCPSGYFLSGCVGYTAWKRIDGWYTQSNNCVAHNGAGGNGIWAIATCCRIKVTPTPQPINIPCTTVVGAYSGKNDDALSTISCPAGYTLTSCGIKTYWTQIDGSYIRNNICYARNGAGGNGVQAVARCCRLGNSINSCRDVQSSKSGNGDDNYVIASCNSNEKALGCSSQTYWKEMDGGCPGGTYCYNKPGRTNPGSTYSLVNSCTAVNGALGGGVWAEARCCNPSSGYRYECIETWGPKSFGSDDAKSTIGCPAGYFLSGCSGYTAWKFIDGWYTENNKCVAHNGAGNSIGIWAIATCCRVFAPGIYYIFYIIFVYVIYNIFCVF